MLHNDSFCSQSLKQIQNGESFNKQKSHLETQYVLRFEWKKSWEKDFGVSGGKKKPDLPLAFWQIGRQKHTSDAQIAFFSCYTEGNLIKILHADMNGKC